MCGARSAPRLSITNMKRNDGRGEAPPDNARWALRILHVWCVERSTSVDNGHENKRFIGSPRAGGLLGGKLLGEKHMQQIKNKLKANKNRLAKMARKAHHFVDEAVFCHFW